MISTTILQIFSQQHYAINVSENFPLNQPITQITATDADGGPFCNGEDDINQQDNVISYSLLNAEGTPFVIDNTTGEISLNQSLNFEGTNQYNFIIQAVDLGVPSLNNTVNVTVNVFDFNDVPPMFNSSMYSGGIEENATVGTQVFVQPPIAAYDVDTGPGGMFQYSLGSVGHTDFRIDPTTGEIFTVVRVDRERRPEYNLMIIATDMGDPQLFSTVPLRITLRDINDNGPHFTQATYSIRVSETLMIGDLVVQIIAIDPDEPDRPVTYEITSDTSMLPFAINMTTGLITVTEDLCSNQDMTYTITVTAQDSPRNSSFVPQRNSTEVTILVYDDNQFAPEFTESQYVFTARNSSPVSTIVGTVATTDRDRCAQVPTALFSLDTTSRFQINTLTGVITSATELLRQDRTIHVFNVIAVDTNTTSPLSSTVRVSVVVGEYIPVNILPADVFPIELPKQVNDTTYVQNFNYFYDAIKNPTSGIVTTFGGLQDTTDVAVNDATPFGLDATILTPYVYPDKPVFVIAVQVVDEHGSDSFPPVDIVAEVCNEYGECFANFQRTADNNVAIVEVPIGNQSWFIDDQNANRTISVEYGYNFNFTNTNYTFDDAAILITTPSVAYYAQQSSSGYMAGDDFVIVRLPLRPLYPTESASFRVQVVEPVSILTMQCIIIGEGLQFTGASSGECYSAVSVSANSTIIQVQAARRVTTRIPGLPDSLFALTCENSTSEETVVEINVRVLDDVQPSIIPISCTGVQIVSLGDGEKINGFVPTILSYIDNSVSANFTEGIVTVGQEIVEQMYATISETVIFNEAVLSGQRVISVLTITGIIIAADIRQFNMRTDNVLSGNFQLNCNTSNSSVLRVAPSCSHLYVDGTESSGSEAVQVYISAYRSARGNVPLPGEFSRSLTVAVWYPSLPITLIVEDPTLNAIRGWTFLRAGSCSLQAFQTTRVHGYAVFSTSPSSTLTATVLVDHLLDGALRTASTDTATVNGLFVTGNLLPGSTTISAVRSGRQLGSVGVTVVLDFVDVIHITVVHSKTLETFFHNSSFLPVGEQTFTVELDDDLDTTEERSELVSAAIFSDGQYYTLNSDVGLKYASIDESFLLVSNTSITPVSSGTGKYLQVDWNSLCDNTNIFSQMTTYSITLEEPTSISVTLAHQFIAHESDTIAQMATYPSTSKITVTGLRSSDMIDVTTDAATEFIYNERMIQFVPDGAGGLTIRSVSADALGETTIYIQYTNRQGNILRASVIITIVRSSNMSASLVPYPSYPDSEQESITTLGQYGDTGIYQKAILRALLHVQSNGIEVNTFVIPHSALMVTHSNPIFTLSSSGVLEPQRDGTSMLTITFSIYSASITVTISSSNVIQVESVDRLELRLGGTFVGNTLVGTQGEVAGFVEADVTFSDNTRYINFFGNGNAFINDLLTLSGDVDDVFTVSDGGAVTILGNAPDTVSIIASNMNITEELMFYSNLLPGVIELDLGDDFEAPLSPVNVNDSITVPLYINTGNFSFSIIEIGLTYDDELLEIVSVNGMDIWPAFPRPSPYPDVVFFDSSVGLFDGKTLIGGILTEPRSGWFHLADIEFKAIAARDHAAFINAQIVVLMDGHMPPQPLSFNQSPAASVSVAIGNGTDLPLTITTVPPSYYEPSLTRCTDPLPCTCDESERGDINGDCVSDLLDAYHYLISFTNDNAIVCSDYDYDMNGMCDINDVFFLFGHNLYLTYFVGFTPDSINPVQCGDCFLRFTATIQGRARSNPPQDRFIFITGLVHNNTDLRPQFIETIPVNGLGEVIQTVGTPLPTITTELYRAAINGSTALLVMNSELIAENIGVFYSTAVYSSSGVIIPSSLTFLAAPYTIVPPPAYPEAYIVYFRPSGTRGYVHYSRLGFNPFTTFSQNLTSPDCINDAGPQFFPRAKTSVVSEGSQPNTIVAFVFANDTDESFNANVSYSFAGEFFMTENDTFRIDPITGNITLLKSIDREVMEVYSNITVEARDAGVKPRMGVGYITILVGDINDNPPVFDQSLYAPTNAIPEATPLNTVVVEVFATDADIDENSRITYRITSSEPADDFSINSTTGEISIMRSLDFEMHRNYTLNITAEDGGDPIMSDTTLVQIRVAPSNDHPPMCTPNYHLALLVEDYPVGTVLATLVASDADIGLDHAELTFTIQPNSEGYHELFDINQQNDTHAYLITNASGIFNRFIIPVYNISVLVTDVGDLNCTIDVEIRVAEGSRFHFALGSGPGLQASAAVQKEVTDFTTVYRQRVGFFEAFESNYVNGTLAAYRFSSDVPLVDSVTISRAPSPITATEAVLHHTTIYPDRPLVTGVAQFHSSSYSTYVRSEDVSYTITPVDSPDTAAVTVEGCDIHPISGLCSLTARIPDEWFLEGGVREATVQVNGILLPNINIVQQLTQPQSELQGIGVRAPFYPVAAGETFTVRLLEFTPDPIVAFHIEVAVSSSITINGLVDDQEWSCNENLEPIILNLLCIRNSRYITLQTPSDDNILGIEMMVNEAATPHTATVSAQVIAVTGIKGRLIDLPSPAVHLDRNGTSNATATFEVIANEPLRLFVCTTHSEVVNTRVFDNTILNIPTETYVVRRAPNPPYSLVPCSEVTLSYGGNAVNVDSSTCDLTLSSTNREGANPAIINVTAFSMTAQLQVRVWFPNQTLEIYVSDPILNAIDNCLGMFQTAWVEVFTNFISGELVSPTLRISDLVELESSNVGVVQINRLNVNGVATGISNISVSGFDVQASVEVTDDTVSVFSVLPMVSTGIRLTATPDTYEDSSSVLYVSAEVSTSFTSIGTGSVGHVTAVVYFTDGARMDLSENLAIRNIEGTAVEEATTGGHIISRNPGISVLTVAWNCASTVGTGQVEVRVDIPQPVGLIIELANDRLASVDTELMIAGIPDQTEVTVLLDFGDGNTEDVTNSAVFGGPRTDNIWTPFASDIAYNDTATLNVSYDYFGQMITGEINVTIVEVESTSIRITYYGNPDVTTDTLRYLTNLTEPRYQQASISLDAVLTDGTTVNIPEFEVYTNGSNCSNKAYVFSPCSVGYEYTYGTPNKSIDFTVAYVSATFASFHNSTLIVVGDCLAPVQIINMFVTIMDTEYPFRKQASIALQLNDSTIIPNVYDYFDDVTQLLSYSTDPTTGLFSFNLANGSITILADHYKMAELTISPVHNPNNISGTGLFVANIDEMDPITVGTTTGIPIPPVQVSDTFTVNVHYNISTMVTGFIAKVTFNSTLLRAVSISSPFTGYTLTNLNSPPGQAVFTGLVLGDGTHLYDGLMFDVEFEALAEGVSPVEVAIQTYDDFSSTTIGSGSGDMPPAVFSYSSSRVMIGLSEYLHENEITASVSARELLTLGEFITLSRNLVNDPMVDADHNNDTVTSVDDIVFGAKVVTGLAHYLWGLSATPVQDSDNCTLLVDVYYSSVGNLLPFPDNTFSFILLTHPDVELLSQSKPRRGGFVSRLDMAVLFEADPIDENGGFQLELVTPITVVDNIGISVILLTGDYFNSTSYEHLTVFTLSQNREESFSVNLMSQRSPLIGLEDVRIGTMATGFMPLELINNTRRSDYCYFDNDGEYIVRPPENSTLNSIIYNVSAVEPGFPCNNEMYFLYTPNEGNGTDTFTLIDPITGGIRLLQPLDREQIPYYTLYYEATYSFPNGSTETLGPALISIRVADINDNTPQMTVINESRTYYEDIAVNTSVVTVTATDEDIDENGRITYSIINITATAPGGDVIQGYDLEQFYINPGTGELIIFNSLDRDTIDSYTLEIQASDNGIEPRVNSTFVFITVMDVNDNPPVFSQSRYNASINENSPNSTLVPNLVLVADDVDLDSAFTYAIVDDTGFPFILDQKLGVFNVTDELDTERQDSYIIEVLAIDNDNGLNSTTVVVITIADLNDNAPQFNQTYEYYFEIDASLGDMVGSVLATDADRTTNSQIKYRILNSNVFGIHPDSGTITTVQPYDGTASRLHNLTIIATDLGTPPLNDTTYVSVILIESQAVSFMPSNRIFLLGYPRWVEDFVYDQAVGFPFTVDVGEATLVSARFGSSPVEDNNAVIPNIGDPAVRIEVLVLQERIYYDQRMITVLVQASDARGTTVPSPTTITVTVTPSPELVTIQNVTKTGTCTTTNKQGFCIVQLVDFPLQWFNKPPATGDQVTVLANIGYNATTERATIEIETHPLYDENSIDSGAQMLLIGPTHTSITGEDYVMELYIRVTDNAPVENSTGGNLVLMRVSVQGPATTTLGEAAVINSIIAGTNWDCSKY